MKKFRIGLIIGAVIIIIAELTFIDYSNLLLSRNIGSYLTTIGLIYVIFSMIFAIKYDKK
jgi:hypothetical protein